MRDTVAPMKNALIAFIALILIAGGAYWYSNQRESAQNEALPPQEVVQETPQATTTPEMEDKTRTTLGQSVGGRDIIAYHYGEGEKEAVFIGGIHGGYEWNTVLLAYELMEYLAMPSTVIPAGVKVTVIPVMNPDGLSKVVGTTSPFAAADVPAAQDVQISGRTNGNGVDLNRNFDCDWRATGTWRNTPVKGGAEPFSEPEAEAVRAYLEAATPEAVVVWFSAADGVYSSSCGGAASAATKALTKTYATASGYASHDTFDAYAVNGDITNWLAKIDIPAISVLLTTHTDIEWIKNRNGVRAVLEAIVADE